MSPLNRNQLASLWFGVLLIVAMGLMPPWREATHERNLLTYAMIFSPPPPTPSGVTIDFSRLIVEWVLAVVLTGGMIATFQKEDERRAQRSGQTHSNQPSVTGQPVDAVQASSAGVVASQPTAPKSPLVPSGPTLDFPQESIGEVLVESADDPEYWETYASATGKVAIPLGKRLQLEVEKGKLVDFGKLEHLPADAFYSIDLSGSQVSDSDLKPIARFIGLRELDLSDTLVTDVGIKNLSALTNLQKIWLDNTRVTDKGLADLAKHTELIKISVTGTDIKEPDVDALAGAFQQKCDVVLGGDS